MHVAVHWGCLLFVIVVFPDHTHYFWEEDVFYSMQRALDWGSKGG